MDIITLNNQLVSNYKNEFFNFGGLSMSMKYFSDKISTNSVFEMLNTYSYLATNGRLLTPTTYILDYNSKKFIAISENIDNLIGYSALYFLEKQIGSQLLVHQTEALWGSLPFQTFFFGKPSSIPLFR